MSYNKTFKDYSTTYLASAVETLDNYVNGEKGDSLMPNNQYASVIHVSDFQSNVAGAESSFEVFRLYQSLPELIFSLSNDPRRAYAKPGTKGVEVMKLNFKTAEEEMELDYLRFKLEGGDSSLLSAAYLYASGDVLAEASFKDNYLVFSGLDYSLAAESAEALQLVVDLVDTSATGKRLRFDIESAEDLDLELGGDDYVLKANYPLRGKYLSVAQERTWTKFEWEAPLKES